MNDKNGLYENYKQKYKLINPVNIKKATKIFGEKANIQKCDFLDSKYPDFSMKSFEFILTAPPI
jgi:hypothetical protein